MHKLIEEKSNEIAMKNIKIIENEILEVCERFNCTLDDLIIEYYDNLNIKIKVNGSNFKIINEFFLIDGVIKETNVGIEKE